MTTAVHPDVLLVMDMMLTTVYPATIMLTGTEEVASVIKVSLEHSVKEPVTTRPPWPTLTILMKPTQATIPMLGDMVWMTISPATSTDNPQPHHLAMDTAIVTVVTVTGQPTKIV